MKNAMLTIEKAVSTKESRYMSRVIRQVTKLRRMLSKPVLTKTVETYISADSAVREQIVGFLAGFADEKMQVDTPAAQPAAAKNEPAEKTEEEKSKDKEEAAWVRKMQGLPEAEIFVQLLFTIVLLDKKKISDATAAASSLIQRAQQFNRRTTDQLLSKGYFYWARCVELTGRSAQIRNELLSAYRTATLKHDQIGQATLLNLLLRNYLEFNLYEQADTLMRKTSFPEGDASNNQLARYLYYTGRIKAVQLEYTDAFRSLQQAARKAPQGSALGFRKTVHKFIVIVQLLLGEIPDRSIFSQKGMIASLKPYLHICQAVRVGDLASFHHAMQVLLSRPTLFCLLRWKPACRHIRIFIVVWAPSLILSLTCFPILVFLALSVLGAWGDFQDGSDLLVDRSPAPQRDQDWSQKDQHGLLAHLARRRVRQAGARVCAGHGVHRGQVHPGWRYRRYY